MRTKLLSIMFFALLGVNGPSVIAEEVVDTSQCKIIEIARQEGAYWTRGLSCPSESSKFIIHFLTYANACFMTPFDYRAYRVTGTCTNFVVYRL